MTNTSIKSKRREMQSHLTLDSFKYHINQVLNYQDELEREEVLIYKLALYQVKKIQNLLYYDIITEKEVADMLMDHTKVDEILSNL